MGRKWIKSFTVIFMLCFCMVGWSFFVEAIAARQTFSSEQDLIRLHVLANSDSPADQQLKLQVRDAVIRYLSPKLEGVTDRALAKKIIQDHKPELIALASETMLAEGVYYPVDVEIGMFDFPLKTYGDIVVPAGKYEAVRVLIGEAEGANWWCVLFPPLCFIDESKVTTAADDPTIQEEMQKTKNTIEFRSKIAELVKEL